MRVSLLLSNASNSSRSLLPLTLLPNTSTKEHQPNPRVIQDVSQQSRKTGIGSHIHQCHPQPRR